VGPPLITLGTADMITELFLTAVITCSTGQAACSSYEVGDMTYVNVCGVISTTKPADSEEKYEPREFDASIDGKPYTLTIAPYCEGT